MLAVMEQDAKGEWYVAARAVCTMSSRRRDDAPGDARRSHAGEPDMVA